MIRRLSLWLVFFITLGSIFFTLFAEKNPFSLIKGSSAKGIEHTFYDDDGKFLFLFVGYDLSFIGDSDDVIFARPKITFSEKNENPSLHAKQAIWRSKIDKVEVSGNVRAFSEEGYRFNTERVDMLRKSQVLEFPGAFEGFYDSLKLEAAKGTYRLKTRQLETSGNTVCEYIPKAKKGTKPKAKEKIRITCVRKMLFDSIKGEVVFQGSVKLIQGTMTLVCEELRLKLKKINGKNDVTYLLAKGGVILQDKTQDFQANCDQVTYDRLKEHAIFVDKKSVVIHRDGLFLRSKTIHFEQKKDLLTTIGHTEVDLKTSLKQADKKKKNEPPLYLQCEDGMLVNTKTQTIRLKSQVKMKREDSVTESDIMTIKYTDIKGKKDVSSFLGVGNVRSEQKTRGLLIKSDRFELDRLTQSLIFTDDKKVNAWIQGNELLAKEILYNLKTESILTDTHTILKIKREAEIIEISSQKGMDFDAEKGHCLFQQSVKLKMEGLDLDCDQMDILFVELDGKSQVKAASGKGNVYCQQKERGLLIESDTFDYDFKNGDIIFKRAKNVSAKIQDHQLFSKVLRYSPALGQLKTEKQTLAKLSVPAQEKKVGKAKSSILNITCMNGMVLDEKKQQVFFYQQVHLKQADFALQCQTLRADYQNSKQGEMEITKVVGEKDVLCLKPSRKLKIQSERFLYGYKSGDIHFMSPKNGVVEGRMDGNHLIGKSILYNQFSESLKTLGDTQMEFVRAANKKSEKKGQLVKIKCEKGLELFPEKQRVEFHQNVHLQDGESDLKCDLLVVAYKEIGEQKEIEKARGEGNVRLKMLAPENEVGNKNQSKSTKKQFFNANCDIFVYNYKLEKVVLLGDRGLEAHYGEQTLICDRFEVNLKTADWVASGNIDGQIDFKDMNK